jgi:hypothetical protein
VCDAKEIVNDERYENCAFIISEKQMWIAVCFGLLCSGLAVLVGCGQTQSLHKPELL